MKRAVWRSGRFSSARFSRLRLFTRGRGRVDLDLDRLLRGDFPLGSLGRGRAASLDEHAADHAGGGDGADRGPGVAVPGNPEVAADRDRMARQSDRLDVELELGRL